jgi:hypothetical protein
MSPRIAENKIFMQSNQITSMRWMSVLSPTWLKILLLIFGIVFTLIGFIGLSPENSSEFTFHFVSVLVEICLGGFITYAIIDEVIKHDKKTRLFSILLSGDWQIANYSKFIVSMSLIKFIPIIRGDNLKKMNDILHRVNKQTVIPESDILNAMWDGFILWERLFFKENSIESKKDYPEIVLSIYEEIYRYIKYIKKIKPENGRYCFRVRTN